MSPSEVSSSGELPIKIAFSNGLLGYVAAAIACVAAPIVGFILTRRGKPTPGIIVAWMPTAGALAAMLLPPPY